MIVKIAVKEPGKRWEIRKVENSLSEYQKIVGGYIEHFYTHGDYAFFCNENGKFMDLKFNFRFRDDFIMGTVFAARSDNEGEFITFDEKDELYFEMLNRLRIPFPSWNMEAAI